MVKYTCWNCSYGHYISRKGHIPGHINCRKLNRNIPKKFEDGPCSSHSKRKKNCQK